MSDIINDILPQGDSEAPQTIDARDFFPMATLDVVSHNTEHIFNDMRVGVGKKLDISNKLILTVKKPKKETLEDLYHGKKYVPRMLHIFSKNRIVRLDPLSIIDPLPKIVFNSLDIRTMEERLSERLHFDIYSFPVPIRKRIRKTLRKNRKRIAIGGIVFASLSISLILLTLAAKTYVERETIRNYNRMSALKDMRDIGTLSKEADDIHRSFETIALVFSPFRTVLDNRLYSHPQVRLAGNVIHGGLTLSDTLEQGIAIARDFQAGLPKNGSCSLSSFLGSGSVSSHDCDIKITDFLRSHKSALEDINTGLADTLSSYAGIESLGNPVFDEKLQKNIQSLLGLKEILTFSLSNFDNIMRMLGDTKPEQYMIINQNQDELRANGGFPGSILAFELYKGRVQKFEKHDVYDYDWKLYPYKETPPSGLEGYSGNFGVRDANYYPDFRDSAKKIGFFVEKAGFNSVDTMIAINQGIIIELLAKYGPVKMPEYNLTIDAMNFSRVVSTLVEARVFPYKKLDTGHTYQSPKEFLFRFMEAFSKQLAEKRDIFGYLNILVNNFQRHEILMASKNSETEAFLETLGTRETWMNDEGNFIYPIFTSLSANKSDRYMQRKLSIKTSSLSGCLVQNVVKLSSDHAMSIDEQIKTRKLLYDFGINDPAEQERLAFIEGNGANKQYIRFLVPKDSILDSGADMKTEIGTGNYTIFSTFHRTEPMKSSLLEFGYTTKVPNCKQVLKSYMQPGIKNLEIVNR
ncbi:MAG: DUF4012 domain-containing protein [Candidatus Gracilibacteria bacterium]|nr:DUF4012 domain-containing protein [Candidatus Gracilibacteria bacterium]